MGSLLEYLFGSASFAPHGYCLLWRPDLVALHAMSDMLIALAYFSIPLGLWVIARQRPEMEHRGLFLLFALFILFCGMTHLLGMITLWAPIYGFQGIVKAATAAISLVAAYSLWPVVPSALAIPGLGQFRQANEAVGRAIVERETLVSGLSAANRDLEDFANTVAHDLRSPLRCMNGYSQILVEDYGSKLDTEGKEMLGRIRNATMVMSRLIEELLFLSQIRQVPLAPTEVDLSQMVRETAAELARDRSGSVPEISIKDGAKVKCDRQLMGIALRHLLDNAFKFSKGEADGKVRFEWERRNGKTLLHIRDNGIGFDMVYAHKLFLPFQRLHDGDEYPGNGVGLAVVMRVVQRHGGTIEADSAPGKGTSFTITL